MLFAGVPNVELLLYARGVHGQLPSGAEGVGAWHQRFLDTMGAHRSFAPGSTACPTFTS